MHQSKDGVRWRGNADEMPDGLGVVPDDVRSAFLGYIEATTALSAVYAYAAKSRVDDLRESNRVLWVALIDELAAQCGVVYRWNDVDAWYWAGDWPCDGTSLWLIHGHTKEMDELARHKMWVGDPWGCAEV